jgi:hypothetical protein
MLSRILCAFLWVACSSAFLNPNVFRLKTNTGSPGIAYHKSRPVSTSHARIGKFLGILSMLENILSLGFLHQSRRCHQGQILGNRFKYDFPMSGPDQFLLQGLNLNRRSLLTQAKPQLQL